MSAKHTQLEQILDQYAQNGGLSLSTVKAYRTEKDNNAVTWAYYCSSGYLFRAMLYTAEEANEPTPIPYLFIGLYLGHIENVVNTPKFLEFLLNTNMTIYDPAKFCLDEGEVVLSLRSRADKISPDYIETLLPVLNYVAEQFYESAKGSYGFIPLAEQNQQLKRMVQ